MSDTERVSGMSAAELRALMVSKLVALKETIETPNNRARAVICIVINDAGESGFTMAAGTAPELVIGALVKTILDFHTSEGRGDLEGRILRTLIQRTAHVAGN